MSDNEWKLQVRTNRHPQTDGEPWGWLSVVGERDIPGVTVTWSGYTGQDFARRMVTAFNAASPPPPEDRGWQELLRESERLVFQMTDHFEPIHDAPSDCECEVCALWRWAKAYRNRARTYLGVPLTDTGSGDEQRSDPIPDPRDAEIARLREALEFYGNPSNWTNAYQANADEQFGTPMSFKNDRHGQRARLALQEPHDATRSEGMTTPLPNKEDQG